MSASRAVVAALAISGTTLLMAASAGAKTYEVTKRSDPTPNGCKKKDCSLREAVIAANGHPGSDKVVLPKRKTYSLRIENSIPPGEDESAEGDLDVTDTLLLSHPGKGRAKVDANAIDRVFDLIAPDTTFKKLTITGGVADNQGGGGIRMVGSANLKLLRSSVKGNDSEGDAGGIRGNDGVMAIRRSKIAGNSADDFAGGVSFSSESTEPSRIVKSTIAGNVADGQGGGVMIFAHPVSIDNSTIAGNRVGGNNGQGGGIAVDGPDAVARVTNSTITKNQATGPGGGIFLGFGHGVHANALTVARNSAKFGGGLYSGTNDPFEIENSLIALNTASDDGPDCTDDGPPAFDIDSLGHNLVSNATDCDGFDATGDRVNSKPKLGKLKNNGGPTQTVALKKRSPAINKADKQSAPNKDQRGEKRGKKPDIGAYERLKKKKGKKRL